MKSNTPNENVILDSAWGENRCNKFDCSPSDSKQAFQLIIRPAIFFGLIFSLFILLGLSLYTLSTTGTSTGRHPIPSAQLSSLSQHLNDLSGQSVDDMSNPNDVPDKKQEFSAEICSVSSSFPTPVHQWCGLITYYAQIHILPPDLVASVIWQESGGNPMAYSKSGAVGLMQIMPRDGIAATFMCINGPCFSDRPATIELQDPEFNINFGTKMLARLLEREGDFREALKFYGPMKTGYYYADKVLDIFDDYGGS